MAPLHFHLPPRRSVMWQPAFVCLSARPSVCLLASSILYKQSGGSHPVGKVVLYVYIWCLVYLSPRSSCPSLGAVMDKKKHLQLATIHIPPHWKFAFSLFCSKLFVFAKTAQVQWAQSEDANRHQRRLAWSCMSWERSIPGGREFVMSNPGHDDSVWVAL